MSAIVTETKIYDDLAEFYPLWRDAYLQKKASESEEVKFLLDVFASSSSIKSVIDLGGGTGVHAIPLAKHGFDVTLLDKSMNALSIAKRDYGDIKTVRKSFETLALKQSFDASICMLSSLTYILEESRRKHFLSWVGTHTRDLIVLDQGNFHLYPKAFNDRLQSEDKYFSLRVARDWYMDGAKKYTNFLYEFADKASDATKVIPDEQVQQYVKVEELVAYLGKDWRLIALLGSYDLKQIFDEHTSSRMICVFKRVDSTADNTVSL
jgi:SAM-dependent methyltransferase